MSCSASDSDRASNAASANCSEAQGYFFRSSVQSNGRGSAPTTRPLSSILPEPGAGRPSNDNKAAFATREEAALPVQERTFFSDGVAVQDIVVSPSAPIMEEVRSAGEFGPMNPHAHATVCLREVWFQSCPKDLGHKIHLASA